MFMGPLEQVKPWQTSGIQGVRRFLDRLHGVASRPLSDEAMSAETLRLMHRTVKKVGEDIASLRFNNAVSAMMIFTNHLNGFERPPREAVEKLVLCLGPYAPHLAEELWETLGHAPSISEQSWPEHDEALCVDEQVELPVQVNGKVRGRVAVPREADEEQALEVALADPVVARHLEGKKLVKVVYVQGRIINLIVR
jgi:leucyl-tRNA synthetase